MNAAAKTQTQEQHPPEQQSQGQEIQQQRPSRMGAPSRGFVAPPANIVATENEYLVELEMPGVDKNGLEATVDENELTVIGRRKQELPEGQLVYSETPLLMDYRRTFELGADVDTNKIRAEMEQGVLKLHLPKREDLKPRKIKVTG